MEAIQKFVEWHLADEGDEILNGMVWISAGMNWKELKMEIVKREKFNQTGNLSSEYYCMILTNR